MDNVYRTAPATAGMLMKGGKEVNTKVCQYIQSRNKKKMFSLPTTGGPSVENLGNVLGNRTQAWSHHLKKAKSLNLQWLLRDRSKVRMHETVVVWEIAVQMQSGSTLQPYC